MLSDLAVPSESTLLAERPVTVALLTNRVGAAERRKIAAGLAAGEIDIVVGTHALLYGDAPFTKLGLAVIDEQHRFGVEQRALLRDLGTAPDGRGRAVAPDVLVMTATPIPRTAAMLVYGDLDRSELREMPPGRTPIVTEVVGPSPLDRRAVYDRLREQVAAGRQAYVVCPLVEGSPKIEAKAATEELEALAAGELAGLRLGLLHGQMKSAEKEAAMTAFRAGEIDVLVATTVIEVGVDVPNATVMIVEDADRFGLSQLHQLRGRVGRGAAESWCFLFADPSTADGTARMEAMVESNDGFDLAERDLEIRGSGQVFGERQAGLGDLRLGRLPRDAKYVEFARTTAERILDDDPDLARNRALARGGRGPVGRGRRVPVQELTEDHAHTTIPGARGGRGGSRRRDRVREQRRLALRRLVAHERREPHDHHDDRCHRHPVARRHRALAAARAGRLRAGRAAVADELAARYRGGDTSEVGAVAVAEVGSGEPLVVVLRETGVSDAVAGRDIEITLEGGDAGWGVASARVRDACVVAVDEADPTQCA